jgi:NADH-quinone oxidoreductase subunit L
MDWINETLFAPAARALGNGLWKGGDVGVIDAAINGSAGAVGGLAGLVRQVQSGYLYWYALVMIMGVIGMMTWQLWPYLSLPLRSLLGL